MSESRQRIEATRLEYVDGDETGVHQHERHQLSYAKTGVLTVSVKASRWVVPPLRAVWIPAGVAHWYENRSSSPTAFICVVPLSTDFQTEWIEPPENA